MNICVFCASSSQVSDAFKSEARLIGQFIAENGHTLIYGGATGGLMDAVAEATHELGGEIIGQDYSTTFRRIEIIKTSH